MIKALPFILVGAMLAGPTVAQTGVLGGFIPYTVNVPAAGVATSNERNDAKKASGGTCVGPNCPGAQDIQEPLGTIGCARCSKQSGVRQ